LLHIGQAVMILKGTVNYFVDTVFNYPTLAECYKMAAFNGINKLTRIEEARMGLRIGVLATNYLWAGAVEATSLAPCTRTPSWATRTASI